MAATNVQAFSGDVEITSNLEVGTANLFVDTESGRVGIGVTLPAYDFDVQNSSDDADKTVARLYSAANASGVSNTNLRLEKGGGYGGILKGFLSQGVGSGLSFNTLNGGTELQVMTMRETGKVGIGTTQQTGQLEVHGEGQSGSGSFLSFNQSGNMGGTIALRDDGGASGNGGAIMFGTNNGFHAAIKALVVDGTTNTVGDLGFYTRGAVGDSTMSQRMTIRNNGSVGIGMTDPSYRFHVTGGKVHVDGADALMMEVKRSGDGPAARIGSTDGILEIGTINSPNGFETVTMQSYIDQGDSGTFSAVDRNLLALQPYVGRVGIGKTNPGVLLDLKRNVVNGCAIQFESSGGYTSSISQKSSSSTDRSLQFTSYPHAGSSPAYKFLTWNGSNNGWNEPLNMSGDGLVGIGTATPYFPMHVNGISSTQLNASANVRWFHPTHEIFNVNNGNGGVALGWSGISIYASHDICAGDHVLAHQGSINTSDARIKKNIVDADDAECLETLRLLKPKKYQYKDEIKRGIEPVWGFIAQEVRETLPYATQLRQDVLPNIYELANVSQSNVITFVNFNTSNLESNATTLIRTKGIDGKDHDVHLAEVIDEHTIRVEEDLTEWIGSVDETGNVITEITTTTLSPEEYETLNDKSGYVANITGYQNANVVVSIEEYNALEDTVGYEKIVQDYTKTTTTYPGTQLFIYGQEVDDFVFLKKEAIWTVATAALQEVDRQLQAEKVKVASLEARIAALEGA